jgi:hypothetical protein
MILKFDTGLKEFVLMCDILYLQVTSIDDDFLRVLSYTSRGCLAPLCAVLGGFVAQEGIKAITGKFTPLHQWVSVWIKQGDHWVQFAVIFCSFTPRTT